MFKMQLLRGEFEHLTVPLEHRGKKRELNIGRMDY